MKTTMYYFSGTGNSFALARKIADGLEEAELISIPGMMKENQIEPATPSFGLIFPVYAWGPPRIVSEFIEKLHPRSEQYVFAVATCGGAPGGTLQQVQRQLQEKGADLKAGFAVREASHAALGENILIRIVGSIAGPPPQTGEERLPEIIAAIKKTQQHKPETSTIAANILGGIIHKGAINVFKAADKDYWVDDTCNLCRTCERICPRGNITIEEKKPVWNHNCELCFACLQWCPQHAIQYQERTVSAPRSHHADVTLEDMLNEQ